MKQSRMMLIKTCVAEGVSKKSTEIDDIVQIVHVDISSATPHTLIARKTSDRQRNG